MQRKICINCWSHNELFTSSNITVKAHCVWKSIDLTQCEITDYIRNSHVPTNIFEYEKCNEQHGYHSLRCFSHVKDTLKFHFISFTLVWFHTTFKTCCTHITSVFIWMKISSGIKLRKFYAFNSRKWLCPKKNLEWITLNWLDAKVTCE